MRAHHRYLHAFGGFEGVFGPLSAATIGHPLGWNPAFCAFAFRVLPFESVSSRPDGSFSCRFCGFQEGAFSMASYRSFRGSKGTLGPCRAVCLWRVGLESCWGSAVSHPYGNFSCRFCGFQGDSKKLIFEKPVWEAASWLKNWLPKLASRISRSCFLKPKKQLLEASKKLVFLASRIGF